jgi:hypothetical protein
MRLNLGFVVFILPSALADGSDKFHYFLALATLPFLSNKC